MQVNRICREHVLSKQEKSRVYKVAILFIELFVALVQLLVQNGSLEQNNN